MPDEHGDRDAGLEAGDQPVGQFAAVGQQGRRQEEPRESSRRAGHRGGHEFETIGLKAPRPRV